MYVVNALKNIWFLKIISMYNGYKMLIRLKNYYITINL